MTENKEKEIEKTLVVKDLPQTQIRRVTGEDGNEYNLVTVEEAITEILEKITELSKAMIGKK
jgi:hypothetical protein